MVNFKCLKFISLKVLIVTLSFKDLNTDVKFITLSAKPLRFICYLRCLAVKVIN